MSVQGLDLQLLLSPLAVDLPSGDDLVYDPAFVAMELAGAGKPERQYGDRIYPEEAPDWTAVHELAAALAGRTRDLRVAVWLTRSGARLQGLAGFAQGLALVRGLIDGLWDSVHPMLDASEGNDPTMRLNAIAPLGFPAAALADLRAAALAPIRGSLTVRDIELGLGRAEAQPGESVPTEAGVVQALQALLPQHPDVVAHAAAAREAAAAITAALDREVGAGQSPDLAGLNSLLVLLVASLDRARGVSGATAELQPPGSAALPSAGADSGVIRNRADAASALERVCEWIERNEPSHPAPLLIRRAQRLLDKSFLEIVRDLAPDGLSQVELIAGPATSS